MSYTIEQLAKVIGATRIGAASANIAWLLTDSRSLSFPEETLFFALESKRNSGVKYIPDLIERGVRNFVISRPAYNKEKASFLAIILYDQNQHLFYLCCCFFKFYLL